MSTYNRNCSNTNDDTKYGVIESENLKACEKDMLDIHWWRQMFGGANSIEKEPASEVRRVENSENQMKETKIQFE
jgi:hypothetical protein